MPTISLYSGKEFEDEFYVRYSKFKHGSKTQARFFGKQVSRVLPFQKGSTIVVYSAPHNNIPTASNAFKDYLLSYCAGVILDMGVTVKQAKINRDYSYDDDYGLMSAEQRKQAISSDIFNIDKSLLKDSDILVFIDDIKITGSHEQRILELLEREGIKNDAVFVYIAEYSGTDPQIEHRLNHRYVNNLKDINDIIRNEEFIFNTRVVKYILKSDIEHFVSFITYQSDVFKETLFSLSILNGYNLNSKYKGNFEILKNLLTNDRTF